jgi:hypothetical protein
VCPVIQADADDRGRSQDNRREYQSRKRPEFAFSQSSGPPVGARSKQVANVREAEFNDMVALDAPSARPVLDSKRQQAQLGSPVDWGSTALRGMPPGYK